MNTFSHSGDLGDLIYAMPAMRALGGGSLILTSGWGVREPFSEQKLEMIRSLFLAQDYIHDIRMWQPGDKITHNFDFFRSRVPQTGSLLSRQLKVWDLDLELWRKPWICGIEPLSVAKYVVARTDRYHGVRSFPFDFANCNSTFVGTIGEWERYGNGISLTATPTLMDLAQVIRGSELLICNQSVPLALAVGMGCAAWVEECPWTRDCHFDRPNLTYK